MALRGAVISTASLAGARGGLVVGLGRQVPPGKRGPTMPAPTKGSGSLLEAAPWTRAPPTPRPERWTRTHLGHTCPVVAHVEGSAKAQKQKEQICPGTQGEAQHRGAGFLLPSS